MSDYWRWPNGIVYTVRAVRALNNSGLMDTLDLIAGIFGFSDANEDNWQDFKRWCYDEGIDLTLAQGPHVITILKIMAAKRGRTDVSTLSSE